MVMTVENRLFESDNTPAYLSGFLFVQLHSRTNFDHEVAFEHAHTLLLTNRASYCACLAFDGDEVACMF